MSKFLVFVIVIMCGAITVSAQTGNDVKHPQAVIEALSKHMDFSEVEQSEHDTSSIRQISYEYTAPGSRKIGVVRVGSPTTYLKEGLTTEEVLQVLGEPAGIYKRVEDGVLVTTYEFRRGGERMLVAEFVHGTLVRSRTKTRDQVAEANR